MWSYFELLSFMALADIAQLKLECSGGSNPRDAKVMLAQEIVTRFHGAQAAHDARADFVNRSKGGVPDDIPEVQLTAPADGGGLGIGALLKQAGLVSSTSEALRLVEQGGVRVDGHAVADKALKLRVAPDL